MSKAVAGSLTTLLLIATGLGSFLFGLLADRYGRKRMLIYAVLTFSVFTFLCRARAQHFHSRHLPRGHWLGHGWRMDLWRRSCGGVLAVQSTRPRHGHCAKRLRHRLCFGRRRCGRPCSRDWLGAASFVLACFRLSSLCGFTKTSPSPPSGPRNPNPPPQPPPKKKLLWRAALPRLLALLSMNTFGLFAWWGLFSWMPAYLALPLAEGGRDFRVFGHRRFCCGD